MEGREVPRIPRRYWDSSQYLTNESTESSANSSRRLNGIKQDTLSEKDLPGCFRAQLVWNRANSLRFALGALILVIVISLSTVLPIRLKSANAPPSNDTPPSNGTSPSSNTVNETTR